jgi:hypothetical protein
VSLISPEVTERNCGARKVRFVSLASGPLSAVSDVLTLVRLAISSCVVLYCVTNALMAAAIVVTSGATVTPSCRCRSR